MANPPGALETLQTNFIPIMGVWVGVAVGFHYILPFLNRKREQPDPFYEQLTWRMSFWFAFPIMFFTWRRYDRGW